VRAALILALMALSAAPAPAQDATSLALTARFGLFKVAEITLDARESDGAYALQARAVGAGLVAAFRDVHFDLNTEGERYHDDWLPRRFVGDTDTGRRQVRVTMRWPQGIPVIDAISPDEPVTEWSLDPALQGDALDPLTAFWRLLRPRPRGELCGWSVDLYDGRRRARLVLHPGQGDPGVMTCGGAYQRIGGYSARELDERGPSSPFSLTFHPRTPDHWYLTEAVVVTRQGRVRVLSTE